MFGLLVYPRQGRDADFGKAGVDIERFVCRASNSTATHQPEHHKYCVEDKLGSSQGQARTVLTSHNIPRLDEVRIMGQLPSLK